MRVFVAGGTGAIGRPLVAQLSGAGHEVTALTRRESMRSPLEAQGAQVVVCDVFHAERLEAAVVDARPDVVINELTELPQSLSPRKLKRAYAANNRVRLEGTRSLLAAAHAAGAKRIISQSSAFWYAPDGDRFRDEEDPMFVECPAPVGEAVRAVRTVEDMTLAAGGLEGVVLRYGIFYGRGTWYSAEGDIGRQVRSRRFPMIGRGQGLTSFVEVEDAASATVAAITAPPGIYNVVDDEPARAREWLPELARALGANAPIRVPEWMVRPVAGRGPLVWMRSSPGASNAKARRDLGWEPRFASWRQGFFEALDERPESVE